MIEASVSYFLTVTVAMSTVLSRRLTVTCRTIEREIVEIPYRMSSGNIYGSGDARGVAIQEAIRLLRVRRGRS